MKTLRFNVDEQELSQVRNKCENDNYLVNKTYNYLRLKFKLSHKWGEYEKHIQFILGKDHYDFFLEADNSIAVPQRFVEERGFQFLLVGYDLETDERITTNTLQVRLIDTGFSDNITSYEDDTKDVYTWIVSRLEDTVTSEQAEGMIGVNVKQALNLITYNIRTYGE